MRCGDPKPPPRTFPHCPKDGNHIIRKGRHEIHTCTARINYEHEEIDGINPSQLHNPASSPAAW